MKVVLHQPSFFEAPTKSHNHNTRPAVAMSFVGSIMVNIFAGDIISRGLKLLEDVGCTVRGSIGANPLVRCECSCGSDVWKHHSNPQASIYTFLVMFE